MNRFLFFLVIFFFSSCNKENKLKKILTDDDKSLWDIPYDELYVNLNNDSIILQKTLSLLFYKDFTCERFNLGPIGRVAVMIGPEINYLELCNKWRIINDSTIEVNCKDIYIIKVINNDTLHLFDKNGIKKHEMYRVQKNWNIHEESVKIRDRLIKNKDYIGNSSIDY